MSADDIIAMIETMIAGLEEQLELAEEGDNLGLRLTLTAKQTSLMKLKHDILERKGAEA